MRVGNERSCFRSNLHPRLHLCGQHWSLLCGGQGKTKLEFLRNVSTHSNLISWKRSPFLMAFFICNVCFRKCRCFRNVHMIPRTPLLHFLDLFKHQSNSWDVHRVESRGVFKACNDQNIPLLQGLSKIFVLQRFSVVVTTNI